MRKVSLLVCVVLALAVCTWAQAAPKVEVFGGYSFVKLDTSFPGVDKFNASGWAGSVTGNVNRYFGLKGEISGNYHSETVDTGDLAGRAEGKLHVHNFLFGPQIGYRAQKVRPFAHALFGVSHGTMDVSSATVPSTQVFSENAFGMALGGGLDVNVTKVVSIRLGQFDYMRTQFGLARTTINGEVVNLGGHDSQNHFRYVAGVVLNFGGTK